jgi:hypothetical protein
MRETLELHLFTAIRSRAAFFCPVILALIVFLSVSGCGVKHIPVDVPQSIRQAKTASLDELLEIIGNYYQISSLSCNELELAFTSSRKIESGFLEKYPTLRGHILLKRPDSIRLVLLVPITKSRLYDILSIGDQFSAWSQRDGKLYRGKNSAKKLVLENESGSKEFSVPRGSHIFQAILPQGMPLDTSEARVGAYEETDAQASYYVLCYIKLTDAPKFHILRKIWIERVGFTITRQQEFAEKDGQLLSDISYSKQTIIQGFSLPVEVHINRPVDGYKLDLQFKSWKVNPDFPSDAFELEPPPDVQIIQLKDK